MGSTLRLVDGTTFKYTNAQYYRNENVIEFTFSPEHTYDEITKVFSSLSDTYNKSNLVEISLLEGETVVGMWSGYTDLLNIKLDERFYYQSGEKINHSVVIITLKKEESISETFMRESEAFKKESKTFMSESEAYKQESEVFKQESEAFRQESETFMRESTEEIKAISQKLGTRTPVEAFDELDHASMPLEELKNLKINALKYQCTDAIYAGFESESLGYSFGFNEYDQVNFTQQLLLVVASNGTYTNVIPWKILGGEVVSLTVEQFMDVVNEAEGHKRKQQDKYWELEVRVKSATKTEEVVAVTW